MAGFKTSGEEISLKTNESNLILQCAFLSVLYIKLFRPACYK
jgi:hypothetical protein